MEKKSLKLQYNKSFYDDLLSCFMLWNSWVRIGFLEIKNNFKRTLFGPLWMVINISILLSLLGFFWSKLHGLDIQIMFPYIILGYIPWLFISTTFIGSATKLSNTYNDSIKFYDIIPLFYIFKDIWLEILKLSYNFIFIFIVIFFFKIELNVYKLFLLPLLIFLFFLNGVLLSYSLSQLNVLFRDINFFLNSLITPIMLITPIFWKKDMLGDYQFYLNFNPFYHFIEIFRQVFIDNIEMTNWIFVFIFTLINFIFCTVISNALRKKIYYHL